MATNLPSISVPFTDQQGRITPIWHEFLRSFVSSAVAGTVAGANVPTSITAGNGLTSSSVGNDVTLTVGQGSGIAVNADDVSVNINNLELIQPQIEDEVMVSDYSDNNVLKKTKIKEMVRLSSPGGISSNMQYNSGGIFEGDSAFTTDGAGAVSLISLQASAGTELAVNNNVNMKNNNNKLYWTGGSSTAYHFGASGGTVYMQGADSTFQLITTTAGYTMNVGSGRSVVWSNSTGFMTITGLGISMVDKQLYRYTVASITASTTQTQGQGALTGDINEISTCANVNDTVTLPGAAAGRHCLVINNGAQTLQVFPASGDNLGAGLNTATTIVSGSRKLFVSYDTTNWEPVI